MTVIIFPGTGVYDLTIIDNVDSRRAGLEGNIYLDAQDQGIVLLRQDNAHPILEWQLCAVKKAEIEDTDVAQDQHKIFHLIVRSEE